MLRGNNIFSIPMILCVAVLIRASLLTGIIFSTPLDFCMLPDSPTYEFPALSILRHGDFGSTPYSPYAPELIRTPGYPLFIATVYKIFGENRMAVLVFQALLDAILINIIFFFGKYLWNKNAGLVAAIVYALNLSSFDVVLYLLSDYSFAFLVAIVMFIGCKLAKPGRRQILTAFLFGLAAASATMVRPVFYYWFIILLAWLLFLTITRRIFWKAALIGILPWILIVVGWQARNKIMTGDSTFCQIQNVNLYLYRAADILSRKNHVPFETQQSAMKTQADLDNKGKSDIERFNYMKRHGLAVIKSEPLLLIRTQIGGAAKLLLGPSATNVFKRSGGKLEYSRGVIGDIFRMSLSEYCRKWLRPHPMLYILLALEYSVLAFVYFSFLKSIWIILRRRESLPIHFFLIGTILYFIAVCAGIEAYARFRVAIEPLLALYAGFAWMNFRRPDPDLKTLPNPH